MGRWGEGVIRRIVKTGPSSVKMLHNILIYLKQLVFYGSMVALDNGAISSIMIWKSPALNVWISDMVYFVPLSRASVRMRVAATRLARSMQFLTVRALEKYGNSLRRSMNSTNLALRVEEKQLHFS